VGKPGAWGERVAAKWGFEAIPAMHVHAATNGVWAPRYVHALAPAYPLLVFLLNALMLSVTMTWIAKKQRVPSQYPCAARGT
jgi:hypothetical protein